MNLLLSQAFQVQEKYFSQSNFEKALAQKLNRNSNKPGKHKSITGYEAIEKIVDIDQSPIGRTPRSNPATYTSVFDDIRDLFAQTNEAKVRGYKKAALVLTSKVAVVKLVAGWYHQN